MSDLPQTKKSLGQHWLTDPATLEEIADLAELTANDTVLEIGPGAGTLTKLLTEQAGQVVAVEFDQKLAGELQSRVPASNLTVVSQDILQFDLTSLPPDYKVVANIPYYLTSKLLRVLAESPNSPAVIILLIQKEVAERVAALPGDMSMLSVSVQLYYEAHLEVVVPALLFTPPPKVDSQVIKLVRRPVPLFKNLDTQSFFRVVKAGFAARRKTLLNSLAGGLRTDKATVEAALNDAGISSAVRPQELSLEQWYQLAQSIDKILKK